MTAGWAIPETAIRVVDPETRRDLPDGQQGLLLARGPGVTAGYLDDAAATDAAFAAGGGWFDTGDLGWRCPEVGAPGQFPPLVLMSICVPLCIHPVRPCLCCVA